MHHHQLDPETLEQTHNACSANPERVLDYRRNACSKRTGITARLTPDYAPSVIEFEESERTPLTGWRQRTAPSPTEMTSVPPVSSEVVPSITK